MTTAVVLDQIRIDGGTQPRAEISVATVREYAELLSAHIILPPPDVFFDGVTYWLADGFHRLFAAKSIERTVITCVVHEGTKRDAVLFSVGANAGHGLQRTNTDKRKAVMTLLTDSEWEKWSDSEIGRRCAVSHGFVGDIRRVLSLASNASEPAVVRTHINKHGTEATMKVGKIGKGKIPMPDRSQTAMAKRRDQMRDMAAAGHSSRQIAAALELSEQGCRDTMRKEGIDVPADRVVGRSLKSDANRIVERMVVDAENLTADVNLIAFASLDRDRLGEWADSLVASKKALDSFIRRLIKEQQKHGEAA